MIGKNWLNSKFALSVGMSYVNRSTSLPISSLKIDDGLCQIGKANPAPGTESRSFILVTKFFAAAFWLSCASVFCSTRSEEHTSELQSQSNLVCRLLLEKKKYR